MVRGRNPNASAPFLSGHLPAPSTSSFSGGKTQLHPGVANHPSLSTSVGVYQFLTASHNVAVRRSTSARVVTR